MSVQQRARAPGAEVRGAPPILPECIGSLCLLGARRHRTVPVAWTDLAAGSGAVRRTAGVRVSKRHPLAPVRSVVDDGLRAVEVVGLLLLLTVGSLLLVAGVMDGVPGLAVMGATCVGVVLLGGLSVVLQLRVLAPPAPTVGVVDGRAATVLRREPVAFRLGLVIVAVMSITPLGWAVLAARSSTLLAVLLAGAGAWLFVPLLLGARGRFSAGVLELDADGLTYRSSGLRLSIPWEEVAAIDAHLPAMVMILSRGDRPISASRTAGLFTGERLLSPDMAVLRTQSMAIDRRVLAAVLWHYATTPSDRGELGSTASLVRLAAAATPR